MHDYISNYISIVDEVMGAFGGPVPHLLATNEFVSSSREYYLLTNTEIKLNTNLYGFEFYLSVAGDIEISVINSLSTREGFSYFEKLKLENESLFGL